VIRGRVFGTHPDWHRRYGEIQIPVHVSAARVLFGGWIGAFELEREWRSPVDPRWLQLVSLGPVALREAAAVLGWIAMLRQPGGIAQVRGAESDARVRCALRYRDVNCVQAHVGESRDAYDVCANGLLLLHRAAQMQWPDIARRLAMMLAPASQEDHDAALTIARIDVARCLSVALAAVRHIGAAPTVAADIEPSA
jgi:hypothetical protein